mmetsp:Transcript_28052/g.90982  ORF Transcript_28052/g.90982 Transcript_28052/m.90982 type:complete len:89 (-) Transcript_28052:237-503(-)
MVNKQRFVNSRISCCRMNASGLEPPPPHYMEDMLEVIPSSIDKFRIFLVWLQIVHYRMSVEESQTHPGWTDLEEVKLHFKGIVDTSIT